MVIVLLIDIVGRGAINRASTCFCKITNPTTYFVVIRIKALLQDYKPLKFPIMPIKREYGIVNFGRESKMSFLSAGCTAIFWRRKESGSLSIPVLTNDLSQIKELIEERKDGSLLLNFNYTIMLWHLMDENEFNETLGKIKKETEWFKKRAVQMVDPFVARVRFIDNAYRYFEGRGVPQFNKGTVQDIKRSHRRT